MKRATLIVPAMILVAVSCSESAPTSTSAATAASTEGGIMQLSSPDFEPEGSIPARLTCDGADESPALNIAGTPEDAVSLVLIMDDPDASVGTFDHWVAFNIAPIDVIPANVGALGTGGVNSWKRTGYGGPCPPAGTHRYFFKILALDTELNLEEGATKDDVIAASQGHTIGEATLMGTYER